MPRTVEVNEADLRISQDVIQLRVGARVRCIQTGPGDLDAGRTTEGIAECPSGITYCLGGVLFCTEKGCGDNDFVMTTCVPPHARMEKADFSQIDSRRSLLL
jgi:hypothetical protein